MAGKLYSRETSDLVQTFINEILGLQQMSLTQGVPILADWGLC